MNLTSSPQIKQVQFAGHVSGKPVFNLASCWNTGAVYPSVEAALAACPRAIVTDEAWQRNPTA